MFLIIYARVIDNKKKGLNFEGPYYGPECKTMHEAHQECKKLVTSSKDHILIKIFNLDEINYLKAKKLASNQFKRTFEQMKISQSVVDMYKNKKVKK